MRRFNYNKKIAVAGTVLALCANGMLSYAAETGTITTMSEKIYNDTDENSTVVGNVVMGNTFSILNALYDLEGNVWYQVETDTGLMGYIKAEKVIDSNQTQSGVPVTTQSEDTEQPESKNVEPIEQEANVKIQVVATETINIRKEPSTEAEIVAKLTQSTTVDSLGIYEDEAGNKWHLVSYVGIEGYVMDKVVETIETVVEPESESQIFTQAAITTTSQTNNTSTNRNTKKNNEITNEEKVNENSAIDVIETESTNNTKSKFHINIDWVAIFSLVGSLLCIGMIICLLNMIKRLNK